MYACVRVCVNAGQATHFLFLFFAMKIHFFATVDFLPVTLFFSIKEAESEKIVLVSGIFDFKDI